MLDWNIVLKQNPWFYNKEDIDLLKIKDAKINLYRKPLKITKNTVYFIKGPRRVGKTIYLKQIAQANPRDSIYINIDTFPNIKSKELQRQLEKDIEINKRKIILLDEIQSLENSCEFLKSLVDLNILKNSCLFITGSDPRAIEKCRQKLIGRSQETKIMAPLNFRQFLLNLSYSKDRKLYDILKDLNISLKDTNNEILEKYKLIQNYFPIINKYFYIYLLTGGFPETINSYFSKDYISLKYYEDIIEKIFEKMDKHKSISILKVLIESLSSSLKYTTIGQKTNYSLTTIKNYIENLKDLLIIFEIKENTKDIIKKFYFKDPFIIHSIKNYYSNLDSFKESKELLFNEKKLGNFIENIIGSHLHNIYNLNLEFYFNKNEVDFLIENKAIEVKYRETITKPNIIPNIKEYLILSKNPPSPADIKSGDRLVIPACVFLALLENPINFL